MIEHILILAINIWFVSFCYWHPKQMEYIIQRHKDFAFGEEPRPSLKQVWGDIRK